MQRLEMYRKHRPSNWLKCNCGNFAEAHVICEGIDDPSTYLDAEYRDELHESHESEVSYRVLRCPLCEHVTIFRYTRLPDEIAERDKSDRDPVIYIKETLFAPTRTRHSSIPSTINEVVNQAEAVASASTRASFILCRAALEEVCRECGISDTQVNNKGKPVFLTLNDRLKMLFQKKNLPNDLQEIMHGIRDLGNQGAHGSQVAFTENVTSKDVDILLSLLDYVLEKIYVEEARSVDATKKLRNLKKKVLNI